MVRKTMVFFGVALLATMIGAPSAQAITSTGGCGDGAAAVIGIGGKPSCYIDLRCPRAVTAPVWACEVSASMHVDGFGKAGGTIELQDLKCPSGGSCSYVRVADDPAGGTSFYGQSSDYCFGPTGCEGAIGGSFQSANYGTLRIVCTADDGPAISYHISCTGSANGWN